MKRIVSIILAGVMSLSLVSCAPEADAPETSETVLVDGINPHVYSRLYDENFDEETKRSFFSFCDALYAGEEEFYCPDDVAFYNVTQTISHQCMPLATYFVDISSCDVSGGRGHIVYTVPKDEYLDRVEDFKDIVSSILKECIKPGYDDVDKALALYNFFETHYIYDHDAEQDGSVRLSSYRLLYEQKGICQEIAPAYAYLLMQAGVECTTCGSLNSINEAHEWAVAVLNGKDYHIDPTWAVTDPGTLRYFGMTDDKRVSEGGWDRSLFNYGEANLFDPRGEMKADDTAFEQIWDSVSYSIDPEENRIDLVTGDGREMTFVY